MLHSESFGQGPNLVFLHGLFGAGDNWRSVGRQLSEQYRVHLIDLPNHGRSPWLDTPSLPVLADHIRQWLRDQNIEQYSLLGHSMGGKVAMEIALSAEQPKPEKLIVVDIAPKRYPPHHQDVFAGLNHVDFTTAKDRKSVEAELRPFIEDDVIRQFLLKSLYKTGDQLAWRFNVKVLEEKYDAVASEPQNELPYSGPTLFIKGMNSHYISKGDEQYIQPLFPNAKAKIIEGAGHWPHAEKPVVFTKLVNDFLKDN